jgi:ribosome-binding ATPase YchF (GTP1/OBG family)
LALIRLWCIIEANAVETLQNQFSGYGSTAKVVARCLDRSGIKTPLETWSDETIEHVVNAFTDEKFPIVIALNKIDHPDSDKVRGLAHFDQSISC